jgi:hypothetical protein
MIALWLCDSFQLAIEAATKAKTEFEASSAAKKLAEEEEIAAIQKVWNIEICCRRSTNSSNLRTFMLNMFSSIDMHFDVWRTHLPLLYQMA